MRVNSFKHYLPFEGFGLAKNRSKEEDESESPRAPHVDLECSVKSLKVFKAWFLHYSVCKQTLLRPNAKSDRQTSEGRMLGDVLLTELFKETKEDSVILYKLC